LITFKNKAEQNVLKEHDSIITEGQRKNIVQANVANDEKQYEKALELYEQAIQMNEFNYPPAYFNMALIAAQLGNYALAIFNMEKYLILSPNADDARKAQDKIYEWEFKLEN
jgi:tetratricopeptide (TPR) repeat protein